MTRYLRNTSFTSLTVTAAMLYASLAAHAQFADLSVTSSPGDFIGQGQTKSIHYTPANSDLFSAQITKTLVSGEPTYLAFALGTVTGSLATNTFTTLDFGSDQLGTPLAVGSYPNAQRAAFASPGHPGLDVTFQNRGSNTLTGSFTITDISFYLDGSSHKQIDTFGVNFVEHSEGRDPTFSGTFFYSAGRNSAVPEPGAVALLSGLIIPTVLIARRRRA